MKELTRRQQSVLEFISQYIGHHEYPPTYQEIADAFDIVSKHGVVRHLVALRPSANDSPALRRPSGGP